MKRLAMKRYILTLIAILGALHSVVAQQNPIAVLEFFEDAAHVTIVDEDGFEVNFYMGMGLSPGDRIITTESSVEIRIDPNGSIMKIAPGTDFALESLEGRDGADTNRVTVRRGRFRMIAASFSDRTSRYEVRTPTAVAGVRGTDFGTEVSSAEDEPASDEAPLGAAPPTEGTPPSEAPPAEGTPPSGTPPTREEFFVFDGEVIVTNIETEEAVFVSSGQSVDLWAPEFLPIEMDAATIAARQGGLAFQRLDPTQVPGVVPVEEPEIVDVEPETLPEPPEDEEETAPGAVDRFFGRLAEISGLQIGSITLNGETYARVAFQPRISIGKLDAALYLPVVYRENLFDPSDWYQPEGNNEWSFGSDKNWSEDPLEGLRDLGTDLALKIRYIEYAERGDPFFLKVGNLSSFTIGQGLLMRNYANDVDFPVVRRIGFNTGIDLEKWGLEVLTNDLAAPEIYGGRIYFRPAAPVIPAAVGISAVTDIVPSDEISLTDRDGDPLDPETVAVLSAARDGEPLFLNVGMDIEVPIVDGDRFSLIGFAEAGGLIPYLREEVTLGAETLNSGLKTSALVDFSSGDLKNFGWTAGGRGQFSILTYRAEFRSYDGIFRPAFYGPNYDRLRGNYAAETVAYLFDTEADEFQVRTMGVAAEAGVDLFDLVFFSAGYFWPWQQDEDGDWEGSNDDEFSIGLALKDGLIPFGITAGAEYRRTHFAATVAGWDEYKDAHLFDAYTTLEGYVRYPLTEAIDLEARISTAVVRNEDGEVVYNNNGSPQVAPVLAIQTRIGF